MALEALVLEMVAAWGPERGIVTCRLSIIRQARCYFFFNSHYSVCSLWQPLTVGTILLLSTVKEDSTQRGSNNYSVGLTPESGRVRGCAGSLRESSWDSLAGGSWSPLLAGAPGISSGATRRGQGCPSNCRSRSEGWPWQGKNLKL